MNRLDVLNTKLIDLINRPVKYTTEGKERKGKIHYVSEGSAAVINPNTYLVWLQWRDLEWTD